MNDPRPVILFDGVCNLCNASVRWVLKHDSRKQFDFASLQSGTARRLLAAAGAPAPGSLPDAIILIDHGGVHTGSAAATRIARRLRFPHSLIGLGAAFPAWLRDPVYRFIARHRYRWFGRRDSCAVRTLGQAHRFLDANENRPPEPHVATPAAGGPEGREPGAR